MGRRRQVIRNTPLSGEEIETLYDIVSQAVRATDFRDKSTDQIFGEIFTRFRTEIGIYGRHDNLKIFCCDLKGLNSYSSYAKILNSIIEELYLEKLETSEYNIDDIELSAIAMESCLSDVKLFNEASSIVVSNLDKINKEYLEESNV